jgi:hypothetical protein
MANRSGGWRDEAGARWDIEGDQTEDDEGGSASEAGAESPWERMLETLGDSDAPAEPLEDVIDPGLIRVAPG